MPFFQWHNVKTLLACSAANFFETGGYNRALEIATDNSDAPRQITPLPSLSNIILTHQQSDNKF